MSVEKQWDEFDEEPIDPEMLIRIDAVREHPSAAITHAEMLAEFGLK